MLLFRGQVIIIITINLIINITIIIIKELGQEKDDGLLIESVQI